MTGRSSRLLLVLQTSNSSLRNASRNTGKRIYSSPHSIYPRLFSGVRGKYAEPSQSDPNREDVQKRKVTRAPAQISLRKTALQAQRSRASMSKKASRELRPGDQSKIVTSYCIAEQYDLERVSLILLKQGYVLDPLRTGLYPQVIHIELPIDFEDVRSVLTNAVDSRSGDVFIFPSGTLVAWGVPEATVSAFTSNFISATTVNPHLEPVETEDLEYIEDPAREISSIKGDTIIIGTKVSTTENETGSKDSLSVDGSATNSSYAPSSGRSVRHVNTVLAKIAFSSGLARSTKLAVLESLLNDYFESTRSIPTMLSRGSRLPFTRSFVLQKTGQLLSVRAQLNLYSELTDSLPDLFWDSRHELGLEGYYDQVGRALDCGIRVKTLNDKMDHAQEIASVLREQLSEQHSLRLEWIIILLIAVEVGFEIRREWRERKEHKS